MKDITSLAVKELRRDRPEQELDRLGGHLFDRMQKLAELNRLDHEIAALKAREQLG